jgi:phosphatidate cytidylyltransferase
MSPELSKRIGTGIVGGGALVALIVWGGWPGMFFMTSVISLAMIYEYSGIVFALEDRSEKKYALLCTAWFVALASLLAPHAEFETLIVCFLAYFAYSLFTAGRHAGPAFVTHLQELALSVFGLIYLAFVPFFLPKIHAAPNGIEWTITFLLVVFAGDTGAYFAGKKYGKTKLYPVISPKKTREGSLGGIAAGYILALFAKVAFFREMPWGAIVVMPFAVGIMAQVGDLCESLVKRAFDKKDSGSILPGHGGFLDRFDGVVFSLPVMYACVRIFG